MRAQALSTANAGMTRLRYKGKASPATLYDCLNAYITISGSIKPRPGTVVDMSLPAGTKGLVAHKGKMIVFSHLPVHIDDERYGCVTLRHPTDSTLALRAIHFAKPFMGYLYVVAAFEDGSQWHYYAEELDGWEAGKMYLPGERVFASLPNGFAYKARATGGENIAWSPGVERKIGDVIEPTISNGYKYTVVAVTGSNPSSGSIEPEWPTEDGARVVEASFGAGGTPPAPKSPESSADPIDPRYDNPNYGGAGNKKYTGRQKLK